MSEQHAGERPSGGGREAKTRGATYGVLVAGSRADRYLFGWILSVASSAMLFCSAERGQAEEEMRRQEA